MKYGGNVSASYPAIAGMVERGHVRRTARGELQAAAVMAQEEIDSLIKNSHYSVHEVREVVLPQFILLHRRTRRRTDLATAVLRYGYSHDRYENQT
jgi:hypothetical protein